MKKESTPGYYNQLPLFKIVRDLRKRLGSEDACIQTQEVALRYLEEQGNASGIAEFLADLCVNYGISHGSIHFKQIKSKIHVSYIVQTYVIVEAFFKSLNEQYRYWNQLDDDKWTTQKSGSNLDPFGQLVTNLPAGKKKELTKLPEYLLIEYYRLIRNAATHLDFFEANTAKPDRYFNSTITPQLEVFKTNYNLEAPNRPGKINYNDFALYTRALKYYLNVVNDACFPEVRSIVEVAFKDDVLQKKLRNFKNGRNEKTNSKKARLLKAYFIGNFDHTKKSMYEQFCKEYVEKEEVSRTPNS